MQSALQLRSAQMLRAASPRAAPLARAVPSAAAPIRKAAAAALHGAGAPSLPARRTAVAPVALPGAAERRAARGGRVACEALGLGALGALCGKILKIFGISSGSAKAATTAAAGSAAAAAGSAGKAAMVAAIGMGILKYLWWAVAAALVVGLATGVLAAYLGVPQVATDAVSKVMGKPGMKLYTNPASRGQIVDWYLQELGVAAEPVNLDMKEKREHKAPEFMAINPFGKVPALSDGGFNLFESGALLLYLADKYPLKSGIFTPQQRAAAAQWTLFANSTLANSVFVEQFREKSFPDVFGNLDKILGEREWLEGGKFSVSDVAVGSYLLYIPAFLPMIDLSPYPNVLSYMERLAQRPACAATVAARAGEHKQEETAKAAAPAPATTATSA